MRAVESTYLMERATQRALRLVCARRPSCALRHEDPVALVQRFVLRLRRSPAVGSAVDGEITLPAEALLRLFYGRLDPEHTPEYAAEGIDLDRLRPVFPGF